MALIFVLVVGQAQFCFAANWNKKNVKTFTNEFGEVYEYENHYFELPEKPQPKPNDATLKTYLKRYINEPTSFFGFEVTPSDQPSTFNKELRTEPYIIEQLEKTALLSYLLYEDGKIVIDELSPSERFGDQVSNSSPLPSRSMGKTFTSYLLGHAICSGFIKSLDQALDDWPRVANTLYEGQRLLDLVNMRAGDQEIAYQNRVFAPVERGVRHVPLRDHIYAINGIQPSKRIYNYNDLVVNVVTNYIRFKVGYDYQEFVGNFLRNKIGIEHSVHFLAVDNYRVAEDGKTGVGAYISNFSASRYDYLRIARAMLNDWQSGNCHGQYLKRVYAERVMKSRPDQRFMQDLRKHNWPNHSYESYAGFFHTDLHSISGKRPVMAMDGYGGQMIVIDFEKGRIVVTNAIYNNFNWKRIVLGVIEDGEI